MNRIDINTWLELKPYNTQIATDSFYLKISNDVRKVFAKKKHSLVLQDYLDKNRIDLLSCFLTSYFEDIISETGIWKSFVRAHLKLYHKKLPFYIMDEYYDDEINLQDVSFLIWYYLNSFQENHFISPFNKFIIEIADNVMDVFDNAWEYAPVNTYLKSFYQIDENEEDYYIARNLIDSLLFKTYLFYPDTYLILLEHEYDILENSHDNEENVLMFLNENRDVHLHNAHTRLLSMAGKEWAAELLHTSPLSKDYLNISKKIQGLFLYKGQDNHNIFIEHIASGKKFNLTKNSFDHSQTLKEIDTILYMGIVKWKNEWWFSGVFFDQPFNADIILDEKNSMESRMAVRFLDHQERETDKELKQQFRAFKDFNNGSQIAFLPTDRIEDFLKRYFDFYNNSLKLSVKEIEDIKKRARQGGLFDTVDNNIDYAEGIESGLVFFNPNSGVEIAMEVNSAFPMPSNPYFKEEDCEEDLSFLLMHQSLSKELAMFCIDNCKTKLPFFNSRIGKKYLEDIDFLLRFWKKDNYHSTPSITYTE